MKTFKQAVVALTAMAMISLSSTSLEACFIYDIDGCGYFDDDCCYGYGYTDCRECCNLGPAIALGTLAIVAIIAIAVRDPHGAHSHAH